MKEEKFLLTVIIVTRNPGDDIYLTLASLLAFDQEKVEIIIKDNSDKEDLSKLNDEFGFKNFKYIHCEDQGIYHAMNDAMDQASGKYLYFLNAGDQYYDSGVEYFLETADEKYGYFYGGFINLYPFPRVVNYTRFMNKYSVYLKYICHQGVIFHRRVFEELGYYDTNLKVESDVLKITEMVSRFKGKKLDNYLSIYKGCGFSTTYESSSEEREYYNRKRDEIYNKFELALLKMTLAIVQLAVRIKNFNKIRKVRKSE